MGNTILQAVIAFVLTGVAGGYIAHRWQTRANREARFFDASKIVYQQMTDSANDLTLLIGKRIYLSQRVCLIDKSSEKYKTVLDEYRQEVVNWNTNLFQNDVRIYTQYRTMHLVDFELLQSQLSALNRNIELMLADKGSKSRADILKDIGIIRSRFFEFIDGMVSEAKLLNRQMHFGVTIPYDDFNLDKFSTNDLIKLLFASRVEGQSITGSPSDFGLPVSIYDTRFGIYK